MAQYLKLLFLFGLAIFIGSCTSHKNILAEAISSDLYLKGIAENPAYEVQIIYTRVDKKKKKFVSYQYKVDPAKYFYPASTVKMPIAILSLQKINELNKSGIDIQKEDIMMTNALTDELTAAYIDTTNAHRKPTLSRYIQKVFAVSDNDAYNRLYEFLGQDYINETLLANGTFTNSVINHRVGIPNLTPKENKMTNNIRFLRNNKVIYDRHESIAQKEWRHNANDAVKGIGYLNRKDSLINHPFDFREKNFYTLRDMEVTLQKVIFPTFFAVGQRFQLTENDYAFLKKTMSDLPKAYSFYNTDEYYDSYVKFLMYGDTKIPIPDHIKIYNKVGNAYGYLIDCAYIEDSVNDIGFFLSATIHVNSNKIYNDGKYEYEEVGLPFLAKLGRAMYAYEMSKKK